MCFVMTRPLGSIFDTMVGTGSLTILNSTQLTYQKWKVIVCDSHNDNYTDSYRDICTVLFIVVVLLDELHVGLVQI